MTARETEWRINTEPVECRSTGKQMVVEGYAARFESRSRPMGPQQFTEVVSRSFFNKQKGDNNFCDVVAQYNHLPAFLLGSVRSGNLEVRVDGNGLWYSVALPPSRRDIFDLVDMRIADGSSFSFVAYDDSWDYVDGMPQRTLITGKTLDVGPTATAAYESASATAAYRSFARQFDASVDEVQADFQNGTQSRYFVRTDNVQSAPVVAVETREVGMDIGAARARLEKMRPTQRRDPKRLLLDLWKMRMDWDNESKSPQDAYRELAEIRAKW